MRVSRRQFVATSAAAALLAGVPTGWTGGVYASDAPESPKVRIGIIALTDCSSHRDGPRARASSRSTASSRRSPRRRRGR